MQNYQTLSCPRCGAPLPATENTEIIACAFCGTKQQRVDIERYIAQLRADVYGWVRSIVPTASISVANVDPVARAQIFEQMIRGEVTGRLGTISAQMMRVASLPLFLPPYTRPFQSTSVAAVVDSKEMLGQAAKFQGLVPFAQSEDQTGFIGDAVAVSETLGYMANVMRIYTEPGPRSYRTVAKNFDAAAESLAKDASRSGAAARMKGLASLTEGTAMLIEGNLSAAETKFAEAERQLASAQTEVMRQPSTAAWYAGIKAERGMVVSMMQLLEAVRASRSYSANHMESLSKLETYVKNFEIAKSKVGGLLMTADRLEPESFKELSVFFRDANLAKAGNSTVYVIGGGGMTVGCWLADLSYSFETGALFMKKGQSVQERMLISGVFPMHAQYVSSQSQALVTDVFAVRSESTFTDRFMGREKTLTTGAGYSVLGLPAKGSLPSSSPVVPPLSTRMDAEKLANVYLEKVRQRLQGKLRIGIPSVTQLVYVSGVISNGWLAVPGLPSSMHPYVGDFNALVGCSI